MILMIEKGIREGICQATHRYAKANNKYMKNYDKNIESSCIEYLDANNLYGWAMSKFNEDFTKNHDENGNIGYLVEVDIVIRKNY